MNSPSSLPSRIHAAAHPSCCAGSVAGVECDLIDRIKAAIEETSAHVCSYCAETLPVSLDEGVNLAAARAHMATCPQHPVRELLIVLTAAWHALRSYQHGNASPALAEEVACRAKAAIAKAEGH